MYCLVFLENGKRNLPVQDFWADLEKSNSKKNQALLQNFQRNLELLAHNGLNIKPPVMRNMVCRKGLYKYRIGLFRVLFTIFDDSIILLHMFEKHTQKTPQRGKIIRMRNMDITLETFVKKIILWVGFSKEVSFPEQKHCHIFSFLPYLTFKLFLSCDVVFSCFSRNIFKNKCFSV